MKAKAKKLKVFVGMSGGVDSSVSVALLQKAGYDITGVFIKVWQPDWIKCTWKEDRLDAMRVCAKLGIPFITLDLEKEYKNDVVDYMIEEYKSGRTPNPDVMCNKYVKFGGFYDFAMKNGADYIATGHYAQNIKGKDGFELMVSKDTNKDQTYFLWTLNQKKLSKVLFPIGHLEKSEVRRLAKKFALPVAEKKDSQGLCFVGKIDFKDFLSHFIKSEKGQVLNEASEVIGEHDGSVFLTIGQRHGFKITSKGDRDLPYFVISKNNDKNTATVSTKENATHYSSLLKKEVQIKNINWTMGNEPDLNKKYTARPRYRAPLKSCKIIKKEQISVIFDEPETIASGQSLVIYDGDICLGGGILE
ncbi:MAG: tRNA 2-thiouridine(34) synthase MnmA [bacterium]